MLHSHPVEKDNPLQKIGDVTTNFLALRPKPYFGQTSLA